MVIMCFIHKLLIVSFGFSHHVKTPIEIMIPKCFYLEHCPIFKPTTRHNVSLMQLHEEENKKKEKPHHTAFNSFIAFDAM